MNFGIESAFSKGLESAFSEGPGPGPDPLYNVCRNGVKYNKFSIATGMMSLPNFFLKKTLGIYKNYLIRSRCLIDSSFFYF